MLENEMGLILQNRCLGVSVCPLYGNVLSVLLGGFLCWEM